MGKEVAAEGKRLKVVHPSVPSEQASFQVASRQEFTKKPWIKHKGLPWRGNYAADLSCGPHARAASAKGDANHGRS